MAEQHRRAILECEPRPGGGDPERAHPYPLAAVQAVAHGSRSRRRPFHGCGDRRGPVARVVEPAPARVVDRGEQPERDRRRCDGEQNEAPAHVRREDAPAHDEEEGHRDRRPHPGSAGHRERDGRGRHPRCARAHCARREADPRTPPCGGGEGPRQNHRQPHQQGGARVDRVAEGADEPPRQEPDQPERVILEPLRDDVAGRRGRAKSDRCDEPPRHPLRAGSQRDGEEQRQQPRRTQ